MPTAGIVLTKPWSDLDVSALNGIDVNNIWEAYRKIPLIYRAVRFRVNSLSRVPFHIYDEKDNEVPYVFEESFPMKNMIQQTELSLLLSGWAFNLRISKSIDFQDTTFHLGDAGIQWLNPFTIQSSLIGGELRFWQILSTGERFPKTQDYWTKEDFVFFREYNPYDDIGQGISATEVALADGKILLSVSQFLGNFFGADALPVTLITLPTNTKEQERDRVETWFKNKLSIVRKFVSRVLAVSAEMKIEKLTAELKTFDFKSVDTHALENVARAYEIPKTVLDSDSNTFATASVEYRSYLNDTIIPRTHFYEKTLNEFLREYGQRIEFAPQELPEMQEDESQRGQSLKNLVDAGMPLEIALKVLGYDISEETQAEWDKLKAEKKQNPPPTPAIDPKTGLPVAMPTNGTPQPQRN